MPGSPHLLSDCPVVHINGLSAQVVHQPDEAFLQLSSFLSFVLLSSSASPSPQSLFSFPPFSPMLFFFLNHFLPLSVSTLSEALFPYLLFLISAPISSPVPDEVPRIAQEQTLPLLSACRGGSLAAGECASDAFLLVPFAWFALTSGLQQPAESNQIFARATPSVLGIPQLKNIYRITHQTLQNNKKLLRKETTYK